MKERNLQEFRNLLTRDWCAKYLAATSGNYQRAVHLYTWNTATSAAFYAPLQALEITLRNQIHEQLTQKYGTFWYDHTAIKFKREHRQQIEKAKSMEKGKQSLAPPSNVVAYLGFGFWVVLLSRYYDGVFGIPHCTNPFLISFLSKEAMYMIVWKNCRGFETGLPITDQSFTWTWAPTIEIFLRLSAGCRRRIRSGSKPIAASEKFSAKNQVIPIYASKKQIRAKVVEMQSPHF